jgi:hypothetical protein
MNQPSNDEAIDIMDSFKAKRSTIKMFNAACAERGVSGDAVLDFLMCGYVAGHRLDLKMIHFEMKEPLKDSDNNPPCQPK